MSAAATSNPAKTALIIGGYSDIGIAIAHALGAEGYQLQLAARNSTRLERDITDLKLRYQIEAEAIELDVADTASHAEFVANLTPQPTLVVSVAGLMTEQAAAQADFAQAEAMITANYSGLVSLFERFASQMEQSGSGCLVGVSSVAGDRGRQTNYIYGSAKAGFSTYLAGLRNRLAGKGVHVLTVKPGFVNTRMTEGMDLPEKLTAEPQEVAAAITKAISKQRNIIYVKPIWQLIMLIIKHIPEFIFKKLDI